MHILMKCTVQEAANIARQHCAEEFNSGIKGLKPHFEPELR
jgi:hypothetical protein